MSASKWDRWAQGTTCPLDAPRDASNDYWDIVAPLKVSSLYLPKNQTYRGHCILILDTRHATRPDELPMQEWATFCADLYKAENAIVQTVRPDHINVAVLGNVIPHLHWHIVPRFRDDPRWGGPIWTTTTAEMLDSRLATDERAELIQKLGSLLA